MSIVSGFLLFLCAIYLPFRPSQVREDRQLWCAVFLVVALHQVATMLQVFVHSLPTVGVDPISFNSFAELGKGRLAHNTYAKFLHFVYVWFGGSHFLGCQISQIGFSVALAIFVKLASDLDLRPVAAPLVLIFGLPPSVVLNTSVVLREGIQVASFLGLASCLLAIRRGSSTPSTYHGLVICICILTCIHNGFPPYLIGFLPIAFLWATRSAPRTRFVVFAVTFLISLALGGTLWKSLERQSTVLSSMAQGRGLEYVSNYATKVETSRSEFLMTLDLSSPEGFFISAPVVTLEYLFAPMPWQIRGTIDLYAVFENMLRVLLFCGVYLEIRNAKGERKSELVFLFCMFLSLELVWAAGTANWGTAFRHRVVAWGLLVLLGGPRLLKKPASITGRRDLGTRAHLRKRQLTRAEIRKQRRRDAKCVNSPETD
jgi:hypothetical protein